MNINEANERPPTIMLPFYCQDEVDHFSWTISQWEKLTKTEIQHQFLLIGRHDFCGDTKVLERLCSKFGKTTKVILGGEAVGHPSACNEMWALGVKELAHLNTIFGFFMESDVVPKRQDWLDQLVSKWRDDYMVMGHINHKEYLLEKGFSELLPVHINGAACYNPKIMEIKFTFEDMVKPWNNQLESAGTAWDVELQKWLKPHQILGFTLFDFYLTPEYISGSLDQKKAAICNDLLINPTGRLMIHGLKSLEEKNYWLEMRNFVTP